MEKVLFPFQKKHPWRDGKQLEGQLEGQLEI